MTVAVVHLVIGIALAVIASVSGPRGYSMFEALSASGIIGGQILLFATWLVFFSNDLLQRLAGFVSGVAVLSVVASICGTEGSSRFDFDTSVVVSLSVIAVAGLC